MKKTLITVFMMLFAHNVYAGVPYWFYQAIKKENPDELAYFISLNQCPISKKALEEIADRVFIQGGITSPNDKHAFLEADLYLTIAVNCQQIGNASWSAGTWAASYNISFGQYKVKPAFDYAVYFGGIGVGSREFMLSTTKEYIEEAITAYVKANFDL